MKRLIPGGGLLIAILVLAYGYWSAATHGSLYITVMDVSDREHSRDVKSVELVFMDSAGEVLAEAMGDEQFGAISISSPTAYSCRDIEKRALSAQDVREEWAECFARQSQWLPTWVRNAVSVQLRSGSCAIHRMPISVTENWDTWWLWWLPLRHIGGKPYSRFSFLVTFNQGSCLGAG